MHRTATAQAMPLVGDGPIEEIAQAYLTTFEGDAGLALRCAITDALSDLMDAERRTRERSRLISRGYVRGGLDGSGTDGSA